ncbi:MAG: TolC family protein [Acidobacteriota bacterium]
MMHGFRNPKVWTLALIAGMVTVTLSAQQPPAAATIPAAGAAAQQPPVSPAPIPGVPQTAVVDKYVVGQATPEPQPGTQMMNLTLEQAMQMALDNNLDLKVARMNPPGVDYQLASARAAFMPQVTGTYRYNNQAQINNDANYLVNSFHNQQANYTAQITKTMPWYGGRLTGSFTSLRGSTDKPRTPINPNFNAGGSFSYTQPLLRGLRMDDTRNQIRTLSISRQVADLQLTSTIENTKASVRTAYWNLRQAIEQIEIQRRSLDLANRLFQDNRTKVEIGTLAPIETTTSETQVANAEQALLNAQIQWRTAELTLKRLLAAGPDDPVYTATINPSETAALSIQSVDIAGAVKTALAGRTDLEQAKRNLDISRLNLEVTRDVTKPQLDLVGGYSITGQNAQVLDSTGAVIGVTGYSNAFNQAFGLDLPTWNLQFNFTYPLFMRAAKANFARAQLQIDQSLASLKASELTVTADVTNAGLNVENTYKQFQAAQKAREVAEKNAEAEQTRFDVGMSTNYNVVQAQTNLTTQRLTELRALISYLNAIAEFDRIQRVGR